GGGAGGAGAAGAGLLLGPLLIVVVAIIAMIAAVSAVSKALYSLGQQGYETALRVADYNGALFAAKTQLEFGRLKRDVQTAGSLADNGSKFMGALNDLEDAIRPLTDMLQNVGLQFITLLAKIATDIVQLLVKFIVFSRIIEMLEWLISH
ncbi:MAG: hypothetical protein WKF77_23995, partial [Planctomycetaceae bacterium]